MDLDIMPRNPRQRKRRLPLLLGFVFVLSFLLTSLAYWYYEWPNSSRVDPPFNGMAKPVFYKGTMFSIPASGEKEGLKLPLPVFKEIIDPAADYEEQSDSLIITTADKVLRLKTNQLTATVNEKPITLKFPVEKTNGIVYVPINPLLDLYKVSILESDQTGAVIIQKAGDAIQWGKPLARSGKSLAVRTEASVKAPIVTDLPAGEAVMIWGESDGWYRVQRTNGFVGYVPKRLIALDHIQSIPKPEAKSSFIPWKPVGGKINLTWQQIYNKNPDTSKIGPMPGLNVISPQWFQLEDGDGNLKNMADPAFSKWAHAQNYQLWALFSNGFDPKRTTDALATYDKRIKMIKQLVSYAQMYNIQGINIDFENVSMKDKSNLVQFVREAVPLLHEQGLVVSIDVTVKDGSENYSLFMDRRAIGEIVDYMIVMAYDEHWASSPQVGSVSSLPWVEKGVEQIIKEDEVPPSKLVLGVPFYTRIWTESKDGKISSKTASMDAVQKLIKDKKLSPAFQAETGQDYVEYTEDGNTNKIWMEDSVSMKSRIDLVKKLDLAGVASWSRTLESPDIWPLIRDELDSRP